MPVTPSRNDSSGFTLVEILIVVVILGMLAAFAIPRYRGQIERARTGEAYERLGLLRKAQLLLFDERGGANLPAVNATSGQPPSWTPDSGWIALGMEGLDSSSSFWYECNTNTGVDGPAHYCKAVRTDVPAGNEKSGGEIWINLDCTPADASCYYCAPPQYQAGPEGQCV